MKELDYLMQYYVNDCYFSASEAHREAFDSLLVMQDPDIYALVTNRTTNADKDIMHVIKVLTQYYKAIIGGRRSSVIGFIYSA